MVVARPRIKQPALCVDRRRRPDRCARRAKQLGPDRIPALWLRFRDGIGLPYWGASRRVERDNRASATATLVLRIDRSAVVANGDGNIELAVEQTGRPRDLNSHTVVNRHLPKGSARHRINRISMPATVTEQSNGTIADASDSDRRAHTRARGVVPIIAARAGVDGINVPILGPRKNPAADDRGLA